MKASFLLTSLTAIFATCSSAASARILVDSSNDCTVEANWSDVTSIEWTGGCVDGKVHGQGNLILLNGDERVWIWKIGEGRGILANNGKLIFDIQLGQIEFNLRKCDKQSSVRSSNYRSVSVLVPSRYSVEIGSLTFEILRRAAVYAVEHCPGRGFDNIDVRIIPEGCSDDHRLSECGIKARNYDPDELTWSEYNNGPARSMNRSIFQYNSQQESLRRQQQRQKQAEDERRRRAEREAEEIQESYEKYVQAVGGYSNIDYVGWKELWTNPFSYVGKEIVFSGYEERMIAADRMIFNLRQGLGEAWYALVEDFDAADFRHGRYGLFVAEVLGNEDFSGTSGIRQVVPKVRFVRRAPCQLEGCADLLKWRQ